VALSLGYGCIFVVGFVGRSQQKLAQRIGTGGTIFVVRVARHSVSNYAFEQMDGTRG
jgi:hypothetical protein